MMINIPYIVIFAFDKRIASKSADIKKECIHEYRKTINRIHYFIIIYLSLKTLTHGINP